MPRPGVREGTIVVYTDIACAWSTVLIARLLRARAELGLTGQVHLDHRVFLLEDVNSFPIPKKFLDSEIPVVGALEPDMGWKNWQADPSEWPVTTAPANEAVHAAKEQSPEAAEELDMALRVAFFRDSRCIALRHEILDIAGGCPHVDARALGEALDDGRARGPMMRDYRANRDAVQGSPHLFFADGYDVHNPGIELKWVGEQGAGFPVVEHDDPGVAADLVRRAAPRVRPSP
ncbi:DsbA family oxidoreductase [Lentzea flaviverrucosa]|uniref:Predicted dithiol-disulfide isomerase, DsbA family n=1 Tax=Lentzea flaviverrucosa TaxID=200379 RepID=A0A1H9H058_9PSEU|nr:dithiol-disulfide isomerase [Lentzea flaviverrucosa]RDI34746.1 putative DsbA family dithiol-disulfide isomerase [Lentzea flaviverrucosa]SEQ55705.1 Predicted dithiol-disulfide isomerase, DsbA family [Lentzea flaviverrucosa]